MSRFHSLPTGNVYRLTPQLAPSAPWLAPLRPIVPPAGPQVFTESATDGLYLLDYTMKTRLHQQTDTMLLSDTALIQALRQLYALDTIFVSDSRQSLREHRQTDGVYLLDVITKLVLFLLQDNLYLLDTATAQKISGLLSFLFTDYLLLGDVMVKTELHQQTEGLFISDSRVSVLLKQVLDTFLVSDTRQSVLERSAQDSLLLGDYSMRLRQALIQDGIYLDETVTRTLIAAVTAMISYVRLHANDPTGASVSDQDALSVRTAVRDFLGVLLQTTKPRLH